MNYKVLWIDDNPNDQEGFEDFAYVNSIELIHFKTSLEGREELERNIEIYDAVILDGLVFDESTEEVPAVTGMQNSINKLKELKARKAIPYFIFTGHLGDDQYGVVRDMLANETIFYKAKDNKKLIEAIKESADKQELTQLKHKYPNAFALCEDDYLGAKQFERVLQLVKDVETPENISNTQEALLPMRKILEAIFTKLNAIGLIPDEIQNNPGAINGASSFLAGNNKIYDYNQELIHPVIAEKTHHLLKLTQDAAHNEGHSLRADSYLGESSNNYLYLSLCYSLLEVLDFYKPFIDANSTKEINIRKWGLKEVSTSSIGEFIGTIIRVSNHWGTFQSDQLRSTISVHPNMMSQHDLHEGSEMKVTTKPSPDGRKTFIDELIEKLN
jgi:hypothetical protein